MSVPRPDVADKDAVRSSLFITAGLTSGDHFPLPPVHRAAVGRQDVVRAPLTNAGVSQPRLGPLPPQLSRADCPLVFMHLCVFPFPLHTYEGRRPFPELELLNCCSTASNVEFKSWVLLLPSIRPSSSSQPLRWELARPLSVIAGSTLDLFDLRYLLFSEGLRNH